MRHFGRDEIFALDPRRVADAMAHALAMVSAGSAIAPVRAHIDLGDGAGTYLISGALPDLDLLTVKVINVRPGNAAHGLERLQGSLTAFDASTGLPIATLDARAATEVRTAACSAVSLRLLGRPDATVLTVFGTGPQAKSHLRALALERSFRETRVIGRSEAAKAAAACKGADVIVTATNSSTPLFPAEALDPGTHLIMIGSGNPTTCQVDERVLGHASAIRVDHRQTCIGESGEIVAALRQHLIRDTDVRELGEVVLGRAAGRTSPDEITIYNSVGNGTQDTALAALLLGRAPL